jgi:ribonuclease Z
LIIEAVALDHEVECFGYRLREKDKLRVRQDRLDAAGLTGPIVGQLLKQGQVEINGKVVRCDEVTEVRAGQSFAFVMDTRPCPGAQTLALGADLLVCEATFLSSESQLAQASGHMTALQAATLARDSGARRLVLGHFSQRYEDANVFLAEAKTVHEDVMLALEPDPTSDSQRHRIAVPERRELRQEA